MKKYVLLLTALFGMVSAQALFAALPKDGFYFAKDPLAYSNAGTAQAAAGMSGQMVVQVQGGKIVKAEFNLVSTDAKFKDLRTSGTNKNFTAAANALEKDLISSQNIKDHSVSGVQAAQSKMFFTLVDKALASQPVAKGQYKKDGWYYAKVPCTPDKEGKTWGIDDTVLLTVVNGTIVDSIWNGIINYTGYSDSKLVVSAADSRGYPMPGKAGKWHEQAAKADAALIKAQDPAKVDAVSGCTIHIADFLTAAKDALKDAK
ncbi:MAG: hypothetical protein LBM77_07425 [Spirochaetaceae bacterium]|nr:hypothetical protein [Spirochaetaceae bacterium]